MSNDHNDPWDGDRAEYDRIFREKRRREMEELADEFGGEADPRWLEEMEADRQEALAAEYARLLESMSWEDEEDEQK